MTDHAAPTLHHALGLPPSSDLPGVLTRQVGHGRLLVGPGDVKADHRLDESQVGIDTGNDNARIYREQFDAHKGDAKVNIDDQDLVQDRVDDISETAARNAA